jgi:3-dehydroquinate dehydratase type I
MNKPKICTVVTGKNIDEFINNLKIISKDSTLLELRIDYIDNISKADVEFILDQLDMSKKYIFTCRHKSQGGNFIGSHDQQKLFLNLALNRNINYIDIDFDIYQKINLHKNSFTKFIISYHNFDNTPNYDKLIEILQIMRSTDADIYKFATQVNNNLDNNIIFKLLINKNSQEEIIALGMGELGKITRIITPLIGGYLTFASVGESNSAPGQIDISELKEIYNNLNC